MLKILIVGATSAIAHETAKYFAGDGAQFFLVGRSPEKLNIVCEDLKARGAKSAHTHQLDMTNHAEQATMFQTCIDTLDGLDVFILAHGSLSDQAAAQSDYTEALNEIDINFLSAVPVLTLVANHFETQRRGSVAVISSVAGDRGRSSNYIYGTAMAAKSAFVQGMRNRLAKVGVPVLTVKPGFVDTPMTAHLKKNFLYASPKQVGKSIYEAMQQKRDVLYTPFFWRYIMLIIRAIPEPIFKRLSL